MCVGAYVTCASTASISRHPSYLHDPVPPGDPVVTQPLLFAFLLLLLLFIWFASKSRYPRYSRNQSIPGSGNRVCLCNRFPNNDIRVEKSGRRRKRGLAGGICHKILTRGFSLVRGVAAIAAAAPDAGRRHSPAFRHQEQQQVEQQHSEPHCKQHFPLSLSYRAYLHRFLSTRTRGANEQTEGKITFISRGSSYSIVLLLPLSPPHSPTDKPELFFSYFSLFQKNSLKNDC